MKSFVIFPGKPVITYDDKLQKPQALKAGSSLIISVNVSGSPDPKVTWFRGDQEITKSNDINIETTKSGSTLTVKGVSSDNAGNYKVVAENEAGSDSAEFSANIKGIAFAVVLHRL